MKLLLSVLLLAFCALARAQAPLPPEIAARQYILIDLNSNQVLAERDADAQAEPASLTKLMTAYLVFNAIRDKKIALDQQLPVSKRAWDQRKLGGSLMFIDTTMTPTVAELLRGMIVQSGNDASIALAEGVAGSVENFVAMMNRQAQAWGLKNTQFKNVEGLTEPGHYSSARDVAQVAARIITEHPQHYAIYSLRDYTYNKIKQDNRNMLLGRDPSVDGMKTGYTEAAGYCLVASAARDTPAGKRRLVSVVLGTASREARAGESQKLLNWGWQAWDTVRLFEAGKAVATVPVWKGTAKEARLGAAGGVFVTVPKGEGDKLKTTLERTDPLVAPLAAGQAVGHIVVTTAGGSAVSKVPLTVLEPVPLAGLLGRAWDAIRLWIQ
ncbi:D-alanyl-D-alanine carboxypeptidase family protein [Rubrivivax rivuli]|uniref:serine-type D-Ala-D-Ala carboxypeptidase n=1 Tax=Rubrivivax rivuli TaxID=1862385 RepID=A0A437REF0_9BURK|nr:D-alanyl-D-alanine carboxypeptidase family protein [Rubrivivax rivuli]RVU45150.1 D-alanyl-D-alanine carboxypeptidase [Rubrivivax rivuli]